MKGWLRGGGGEELGECKERKCGGEEEGRRRCSWT